MIKIILLDESAKIPVRFNPTDAGADLFSLEDFNLKPGERKTIRTGVSLEIPEGYYGRIAPRSGLASKQGIDVLAGVIDSSYRGEVKVVLLNTDKDNSFHGTKGDRIAQLIIERHFNLPFVLAEELSESERGSGGFGSTGSSTTQPLKGL
jgi:dUTP pyrophosphatase